MSDQECNFKATPVQVFWVFRINPIIKDLACRKVRPQETVHHSEMLSAHQNFSGLTLPTAPLRQFSFINEDASLQPI